MPYDSPPQHATSSGHDAALIDLAAVAEVSLGDVSYHTDKSIVAGGIRHGEDVVIKFLTTSDPYWVARRDHEISIYRKLAATPPAVPVPQMLWADKQLTVLSSLSGDRLGNQRHLAGDLTPETATAVFAALEAITRWGAPGLPEPIADYYGRADAEHAAGLIDDPTRLRLHELTDKVGDIRVPAHGDPLPTNVLVRPDGCALVDFEYTGRYLPGYDEAMLHVIGAGKSPTLAETVRNRINAQHTESAYAVNLCLLVCREIRFHKALPTTQLKVQRLRALEEQRRHAADLLVKAIEASL